MSIVFKNTRRGMSISASGKDAQALFDVMTKRDAPVQPNVLKQAMNSKAAQRNPEVAVATWNNAVNVGQEVDYRDYPEAEPVRFKTRTRAEVLSGHTAVVWLEGKAGCVTLKSLTLVAVEGGAA